ncbi:hypothetical protein V1515DRAFT_637435 [Lipomyces mesembrius]
MSSERQDRRRRRHDRVSTNQLQSMTEHSDLLDIVRLPISPDVRLEVQTTRKEYEEVQEILENEESEYPKLWYDGSSNVAIVVGPPSALRGKMAGGLLTSISREVLKQQGLSEDVKDGVTLSTDIGNTRGRTTRGWDGESGHSVIAVEVGVSQAYEKGRRGETPDLHYSSLEEENAVVTEAEEDFRHQLTEHPYGSLVRDGLTWFEQIRQDVDLPTGTFLDPSQSFTVVDDGEFVGDDGPANLQEVVLGDCIPNHILTGEAIVATPVNFFRRSWFEEQFGDGMVRTAGNRMRPRTRAV